VAFNTEGPIAERAIGMTGGDESRMSPDFRLKRLR
jgi:hypothetical protein